MSATNGMITNIWGPPLWHYLHTVSFNYPTKRPSSSHKKNHKQWLLSIGKTLPCKYCRQNFNKNIKNVRRANGSVWTLEDALKNRQTFTRWMYEFHKVVSSMLGKKTNITFDEVRNRYESFRSQCRKTPKKTDNENGCVYPSDYIYKKCVMTIVPRKKKVGTFTVLPSCRSKSC